MFTLFNNRPNKNSTSYIMSHYDLYDKFITDRAAGAVNGTSAEPIGGARTVTDTNSKLSIGSGVLNFATGGGGLGDPGLWYSIYTRVAGRILIAQITSNSINNNSGSVGWDANQAGFGTDVIRFLSSGSLSTYQNGASIISGLFVDGTTYSVAIAMRETGMFYYIKGGAYTNWTLLWLSALGNIAMYPNVNGSTLSVFTADNIRVPKRLFIPVPLQSDGFSAATTDGAGTPEANGPVGSVWTNVGTWGVAGGVRSCSALSGGVGYSYLAHTSANVIIDAVCTRSAGVTGLVARYADADNLLKTYHDGTNVKLDKIVAGVTTNLISAAATYGATKVTRLILDGTTARLFYDNVAIGGAVTVPSSSSLNHGLHTTDTGATFDNYGCWARGNSETQWEGLNNL